MEEKSELQNTHLCMTHTLAILIPTRDFVCLCFIDNTNTSAKIREFVKTCDFVPIEATGPPIKATLDFLCLLQQLAILHEWM